MPVAAIVGYLGVVSGLRCLPTHGACGCFLASAIGIFATCWLARPLRITEQTSSRRTAGTRKGPSRQSRAVARSAVPAAYFLAVRGLRSAAGPNWAGQFMTFPGASLSVLVNTHWESGPAAAVKMAAAMPWGGLGMLAFLMTFRLTVPALGLFWGMVLAYGSAVAMLLAVGAMAGPAPRPIPNLQPLVRWLSRWGDQERRVVLRLDPAPRRERGKPLLGNVQRSIPPRRRRFSPRLEALMA